MKHLKLFENYQSDEEIHEICEKYYIENYTINNGLVDVDGHVNLSKKGLTELPLKFGKVNGDFYCHNNKLTTLEGAPTEVNGNFWCYNNSLKTIKNSPNLVNGEYDCSINLIEDFQGMPKEINGDFVISFNSVKSFEGFTKLKKLLFISDNPIEEIYEQIGSAKHLDEFNMLSIIQEIDGVWSIYKFKLDHFMEDIYDKEFDYSKIKSYKIIED